MKETMAKLTDEQIKALPFHWFLTAKKTVYHEEIELRFLCQKYEGVGCYYIALYEGTARPHQMACDIDKFVQWTRNTVANLKSDEFEIVEGAAL